MPANSLDHSEWMLLQEARVKLLAGLMRAKAIPTGSVLLDQAGERPVGELCHRLGVQISEEHPADARKSVQVGDGAPKSSGASTVRYVHDLTPIETPPQLLKLLQEIDADFKKRALSKVRQKHGANTNQPVDVERPGYGVCIEQLYPDAKAVIGLRFFSEHSLGIKYFRKYAAALSTQLGQNIHVHSVKTPELSGNYCRESRPTLQSGLAIGLESVFDSLGGIGAFVREVGNPKSDVFLLGSGHVLSHYGRWPTGGVVVHPEHKPGALARRIGTVVSTIWCGKLGADVAMDCGLAKLNGAGSTNGVGERHVRVFGPPRDEPVIGEMVCKHGPGTAQAERRGWIRGLDAYFYYYDERQIRHRYSGLFEVIADDGPFALQGDSGCVIYDSDHRPIGLIVAVSDRRGPDDTLGVTYAVPITRCLSALGVEFA